MEKSWNFETGAKSRAKVMGFDKQNVNSHESAPVRGSFSKSMEVMEFCDTVMKKSWKSHGSLSRRFRGNPIQ